MTPTPMIGAIRERLAACRVPDDPTRIDASTANSPWAPFAKNLKEQQKPLIVAGVLLPIIERDGELSLILTKRSAELRVHAGQVSFPGGRMEHDDVDVVATAIRETHEEIGVAPADVEVLGCLSTLPTITGYAVTPVVGFLRRGVQLTVDPAEVDFAFEVPLAHFLDDENEHWIDREVFGETLSMLEFHWGEQRIWGATAYILESFRKHFIKS